MTSICLNQNVPGNFPDIYEVSYKNIFTHVNFNFSVFSICRSENGVGRPKKPPLAKFKAIILKYLALNSSYRTTEAKLAQGAEIAINPGSHPDSTLNDTVLKQFFAEHQLKQILAVYRQLLQKLRSFGYVRGRTIAQDSTPIEAHCRPPTKRGAPAKDPDAQWGKIKCKGGWYFGYKA
ncbi:MAG: hypothetical protein ACFFD2_04275 [Promethearchaeota archaeon]